MSYQGFPSGVQHRPAKGVPGDKATLNPFVYTDRNFLAGDDGVVMGNFVWEAQAGSSSGVSYALSFTPAPGQGATAAQPLGIVERNHSLVNHDLSDGGTLNVPENTPLNVVRRGDLYAVSENAAAAGQKVFAVLSGGAIKAGAAGATITGAVETAWVVTEGGAAGELVTISNW
jgi:hypothetical protein